jgi:hypothetical protein
MLRRLSPELTAVLGLVFVLLLASALGHALTLLKPTAATRSTPALQETVPVLPCDTTKLIYDCSHDKGYSLDGKRL